MTVEEVTGRLKTHEDHLGGFGDAEEEHVLLMHAEWNAEWKAKDESENSLRRRGCSCGRGHGEDWDKTKVRCYNYQDFGHFVYECPTKKKDQALLIEAQSEDDEPALL